MNKMRIAGVAAVYGIGVFLFLMAVMAYGGV